MKLETIKNQKTLGAFGGLGSYMGDLGVGRRTAIATAAGESRSGNIAVAGRGSINLAKNFSDIL